MDVALRSLSEQGGGDNDDPPAQEVERQFPPGIRERVVEVEREIPFIEREVPATG